MRYKITFVFILALLFFTNNKITAQSNLVIDGSFEELKNPVGDSDCINFYDLTKWWIPNNNYTRYYSSKSKENICSPLNNQIYYQKPKEGFGFIGIFTVQEGHPDIARSYVQGKLTEPMVKDKSYEVKFYVTLANRLGMSVSTIGALLTTSAISFTNRCDLVPQVESNWHLTDTLNWMEIKGEFTAQGGEQYITIGNFRTDAESDTLRVETGIISSVMRTGFYTLDDVSVICLDCTVGINEQVQNKNVVYNSSTNTLNVSERGNLVIYNMQGAKVKELKINGQAFVSFSADDLGGAGVYIWQLQTEKEVQRGKFASSNSP